MLPVAAAPEARLLGPLPEEAAPGPAGAKRFRLGPGPGLVRTADDFAGLDRRLRRAGAAGPPPPRAKLLKARPDAGRALLATLQAADAWLGQARALALAGGPETEAIWRDFCDPQLTPGYGRVLAHRGQVHSADGAGADGGGAGGDGGQARRLQQYFTAPAAAEALCAGVLELLGGAEAALASYRFIDPAAGDGALLEALPPQAGRRCGVDLDAALAAKHNWIQGDFLALDPDQLRELAGAEPPARVVVVANPPFSGRDREGNVAKDLPVRFLARALELADTVAMIMPPRYAASQHALEHVLAETARLRGGPTARLEVRTEAGAAEAFAIAGKRVHQPTSRVFVRVVHQHASS